MRHSLFCTLVASLCFAGTALAQPADEARSRAEARRFAEEGQALLEKGKPREALESLRKAEAAYHAPTIVLLMAQARRDLGETRAAIALYRRVLAEPLAADASPAFRSAHEIAAIELGETRARAGLVDLVLRPAGVQASVVIAGDAVSGAGPYEVDPATATVIRVSAQGYEPAEQTLTVALGARQRIAPHRPAPSLSPSAAYARPIGPGRAEEIPGAASAAALNKSIPAITMEHQVPMAHSTVQSVATRLTN